MLPYLDIPIQHCNDRVLKAMNRRGDKAELLALFRKLRARIPSLVLRTSLITGLPFEDEAAFEELCEFLQEVRIERAGVFLILRRRDAGGAYAEPCGHRRGRAPGGAGGGRTVPDHG